ncbi:phage tail protein [Acinetobacter qingfengensis]|nr:hypothetical protein [Acinetobacter qingfengensis]KAA8734911.1 phage tail protein [Acinetobacter qingfengensis]
MSTNGYYQNALQMIKGHEHFLINATGLTEDAELQHYLINPDEIIANALHFSNKSAMQGYPNGAAYSEAQSIQILGYAYCYLATKEQYWLDRAITMFDGYMNWFYFGQNIPAEPQNMIAHWAINGKEPFLSHYPIDWISPSASGFLGISLNYVNGIAKIPHDSPYFGQYLDKATYAFIGHLAWQSLVAEVRHIDATGVVDWNTAGTQYDVDWIINWQGYKINSDKQVVSTGHSDAEKGTICLKNSSVNGEIKTNFTCRVPVEHGGYLIKRNELIFQEPCEVPIANGNAQQASDAEEWFADAAYLLYKITGEDKYRIMWKTAIKVCNDYADIDLTDKFFRQDLTANTPFTDGTSYGYSYPNTVSVTYGRDANGYITIASDVAVQHTIEQKAVWWKVDNTANIVLNYACVDSDGNIPTVTCTFKLGPNKNEEGVTEYSATLPSSASMTTYNVKLSSFVKTTTASGIEYITGKSNAHSSYGNTIKSVTWGEGMLHDNRAGGICQAVMPATSDGYIIGFWGLKTTKVLVNSISYSTTAAVKLRITDDDGWNWYWTLPATTKVVTHALAISDLTIDSYQTNTGTKPTVANYTLGSTQLVILPMTANTTFQWYCINDVPETFSDNVAYTVLFGLKFTSATGLTAKVGDCYISNYLGANLAYTPGIIPYANNTSVNSTVYNGWRGLPFPGYMHPFIWTIEDTAGEYETKLNNMVDFLYDSQIAYYNWYGELGPGMAAYVWNRWDNTPYGAADSWIFKHWHAHAWQGYQARAFSSAARAWYELVLQNKEVPINLIKYVENWLQWLYTTSKANGMTVTDWDVNGVPKFSYYGFQPDMAGLWLSGACLAYFAGCKLETLPNFIEMSAGFIQNFYQSTGIGGHHMNGCITAVPRLNTGSGVENNGMFYGFYSGELLKGLALYLLYKTLPAKADMYKK